MRCSKCGTEGIPGKKFCAECGSPLSNRCSNCNSDNAPGAKFCADCGNALSIGIGSVDANARSSAPEAPSTFRIALEQSGASPPAGERKTVTALFADIKGSTELMADLDPEEARAIVDPASTHVLSPRAVRASIRVCRYMLTLRASAGPRSRCMLRMPASGAPKKSKPESGVRTMAIGAPERCGTGELVVFVLASNPTFYLKRE